MIPRSSLLSQGVRGSQFPARGNSHILRRTWPRQALFSTTRRQYLELSEAGENNTGHIQAGPNEGIFFVNGIYPLRLQWLLRLPFASGRAMPRIMDRVKLSDIAAGDPASMLAKLSKEGKAINVIEVLPRLKEGGAFVKFSHDEAISKTEIETALRQLLTDNQIHPWWNPFSTMHARLVRGRPWVEDLFRLPSQRLKVEFVPPKPDEQAAELSQEQLYELFRPFGKLQDVLSQPSDSKILPKYAYLDYMSKKKSIMARNCMHGYLVTEANGGGKSGTLLKLTYEARQSKANWIKDWLLSHPRIVIPILAALLATISLAIFDPLRTFFIKVHITRQFHFTDYKIVKWFLTQATDILSFRHKSSKDGGMRAIWDDRKVNIEQIQTWLMETADTFIIVQGPRGSGKKELVVDQALQNRKYTLVIDCKPVQEARGDSAKINAAAAEVGYRPVFSWMNSISGFIDLAAQGTAGVKTGFSETVDTQLAKIWNNTATALKKIALSSRHKDDSDAHLADDDWLEAHPERRPVVVIDNFLHKSQEDQIVYDKIAEWAARVTTTNIAHVIFLTTDVSFSKSLSKALPDRVFRQISLSDCSPEVAKRYVVTQLDASKHDKDDPDAAVPLTKSQRRQDLAELDECISYLGGRLTDLEFLARRIKAGQTPKKAVKEIIEQSSSEILKMYILGLDETRKWSAEQAWYLIKQLANDDAVRYNEVLLSDLFKSGGEKTLQALEQAELISIVSLNGRPYSIKPGKPVYSSAFQGLTSDSVLRSRLDLSILTDQIKSENANIDKYEAELKTLSDLKKHPSEVTGRIQYLLSKLQASHVKVEQCEKESATLKKILQTEY